MFASLVILSQNTESLNGTLTCKLYNMATVHLQDTQITSEGASGIMGLHRLKQEDTTLLRLITIFTME